MVMRSLNILLTNDDGFDSPYLYMLCRAAADRGHHVTVCAPRDQQSGKSQSFSMTPLFAHERAMEGAEKAYALEGTPADCARAGIKCLCDPRPDLVISGMNKGYNAGLSTFVSGTVGAARQAAFNDIPALAVSVHDRTPDETARFFAEWAVKMGEHMLDVRLPRHAVVSINVPPIPPQQLKPPVLCSLSEAMYYDRYRVERVSEDSLKLELCSFMENPHPDPGSDMEMLNDGHITVTVLTPSGCCQSDFSALLY